MDRTHDDTTTTTAATGSNPGRNRRRIAALGAAFTLAALGAGAMVAGGGGGSDRPDTTAAATAPTSTTVLDDLVEVADTAPAASPTGGGEAAPKNPVPQPPAAEEPADEPAAEDEGPAEPDAAPGVLAVSKSLIELPAKTWAGTFQVRNDGGSPIDWQWAAGAAGISVSHTGGTLQPGEFVEVSFTIDHTLLPAGDFLFANCVYTADQAKDVRIEGTKTIAKNPQIELPDPVLKS